METELNMPLTEKVTINRVVDPRLTDLVLFARTLVGKDIKALTDDELIGLARDFWETQHGDD